jgi:PAS domain S-box-containing protein
MARLEVSQAALAESEAELRLVADTAPGLIAFVDAGLALRFANLAHEEWFGVPVQDIVGKTFEQVLGSQGWHEQKENIERALSGQAVHVEVLWPSAEGRRRYAEVRYLPRFDSAGQVDGFHAFASDITVRRVALEATRHQATLLESRVAERTNELQREMAARQESEAALRQAQKMEAVGQLTGGIAHDFNNMLTGILAAMELLRARVDDGKLDGISRLIDIASTSAQRAAGLTQRLLAFSRRQSLDPRPVDVRALVDSMEDLFTRTLGERVRLRTSLAEDAPRAMVDANQLESALLNLVINARDAMPDGGEVEIYTSLQTVPDDMGDRASATPYVRLCVSDTGIGMDEETVARVFEPFFTTKPIGQGTGLGMSMIYGFINQSNGHVRITSSPGKGTTICLYLPVAGDTAIGHAESAAAAALVEGRGQTILVVDDDVQVRALVTELLEELGYAVQATGSAEEALPVLAAQQFDLLLTDVGLPGLNGRQFAEIARQSQPWLPVLFMTGYAHTAVSRGDFLAEGMRMIAKPFSLVALSDAVAAILGMAGRIE